MIGSPVRYELYLTIEDIDHSKTKVKSPHINGICESFTKPFSRAVGAEEFYAIAFRKKVRDSFEGLQKDLNSWLEEYNRNRTHSGEYCYGKTPYQTFTVRRGGRVLALSENQVIGASC